MSLPVDTADPRRAGRLPASLATATDVRFAAHRQAEPRLPPARLTVVGSSPTNRRTCDGSPGVVVSRPLFATVAQQCPPYRGGPISVEPRINDRIRVPEVRLVGPNGEQVGIVAIGDALRLAQEADLDLVEVAPTARPPVAKLMDYGKYKYETAQKAREARRNQVHTVIKEMKLRPKIDPHDYETKKGHVVRFLKAGDKVKITIMFRGREQSRPELGFRLLKRLAEDVQELGYVEFEPKQDGRNMIMVMAPHRKQQQQHRRAETADAAPAAAAEIAE